MKHFAAILLTLTLTLSPVLAAEGSPAFSDVDSASWYAPYVAACADAGIMEGTGGGRFSPDAPLTLAQCVVLGARTYSALQGQGGALPDIPPDLNDLVRFYDKEGHQVGNWADVTSIGYGNMFVGFAPDFWGRIDRERPLTMMLDISFIDWSSHHMWPTGPLTYPGNYRQVTDTSTEAPIDGYYFEVGEDFDGGLWEALSWALPWLIDEFNVFDAAHPAYWWRDALIYLTQQVDLGSVGAGHPYPDGAAQDPEAMAVYLNTEPAWRQDFAWMLYSVTEPADPLPRSSLVALPDTDDPAALSLYNAEILTGVDEIGAFAGERGLTRAEAAAMIARVLEPGLRAGG